jgi:hypothetical protein
MRYVQTLAAWAILVVIVLQTSWTLVEGAITLAPQTCTSWSFFNQRQLEFELTYRASNSTHAIAIVAHESDLDKCQPTSKVQCPALKSVRTLAPGSTGKQTITLYPFDKYVLIACNVGFTYPLDVTQSTTAKREEWLAPTIIFSIVFAVFLIGVTVSLVKGRYVFEGLNNAR